MGVQWRERAFVLLAGLILCSPVLSQETRVRMPFQITSAAFAQGSAIPKNYSCEGTDISPALHWGDPPAGTQSFAMVMDDPDAPAGTWVHWVLWNVPGGTRDLGENVPKQQELPDGSRQGRNDFRKVGYNGPCPPGGKTHRYFFRLYALDTKLDLRPGSGRPDLDSAMKGHVLGETELMGTFRR